jgi:isoleucyl-tRNA synthetase
MLLDVLVRMLAPLIPFTADEIYAYMPGQAVESVHLLTLREPDARFADADLEARWDRLLEVREQALKVLETMRQAGAIGAPLEARLGLGVAATANDGLKDILQRYRSALEDLFIVSGVSILDDAEVADLQDKTNGREDFKLDGLFGRISAQPPIVVVGRRAPGRKCLRCWKYFEDGTESDLDERCRAVVRA